MDLFLNLISENHGSCFPIILLVISPWMPPEMRLYTFMFCLISYLLFPQFLLWLLSLLLIPLFLVSRGAGHLSLGCPSWLGFFLGESHKGKFYTNGYFWIPVGHVVRIEMPKDAMEGYRWGSVHLYLMLWTRVRQSCRMGYCCLWIFPSGHGWNSSCTRVTVLASLW